MKVLVTGGAGFIGSNLVDALLKKGNDVLVLDNFFSGREKNLSEAQSLAQKKSLKLEIVKGDISLEETWKKLPAVAAVFHISAQTSVTASVKESTRDFAWNVQAARYLIDFIRAKNVRHLLYSNTAGALYGAPKQTPTPEEHPIHPSCPYGATKSFLEVYIRAFAESLKMEGTWSTDVKDANYFTWSSLRLGNVYGPRQITKGEAGVVPIFIEKFLAKTTPTIFGSGKETRDYVHVDDVVAAFMRLFELQQKKPDDEAYNVGTSVETSTQNVFDEVRSALGAKSNGIAKADHASLRPGELERSCLKIDKLKKTGWSPEWKFHDGVKNTVEHYLTFEGK